MIYLFLGLLASVGIGFVVYGSVNVVKIERSIARTVKNRELSKIDTLRRIDTTCTNIEKILKDDSTDNNTGEQLEKLFGKLRAIHSYIEKYF